MYKCVRCGKEFDTKQKLGGHVSGHARASAALPKSRKSSRCQCCGNTIKFGNKYCNQACKAEYNRLLWERDWLSGAISGFSENDRYANVPHKIRNYMLRTRNYKCEQCGWGEMNPFTKNIPLEVDHIDGDYRNNRPENLQLLCPNCHSLTKTYRGSNVGHGRPAKRQYAYKMAHLND